MRRIALPVLSVLLLVSLVCGPAHFSAAAQEVAAGQPLFQGITYTRDVRADPRPLVIHIVAIDLGAPGLRFLVTPDDTPADGTVPARTTSGFLAEFGLQVAINGDFFDYTTGPETVWDLFSRLGDPVAPVGFAASQGVILSTGRGPTLYLDADNRAGFDAPPGPVYNAVSGDCLFLVVGRPAPCGQPHHVGLHPRTAVALDVSGGVLLLIVVDGRQPGVSEGVTLAELAGIAAEYGGSTALNLDGGGSSALVVEGTTGEPLLLNSPIEHGIPGLERAVANHLGVYALPVEAGL